MKKPVVAICVAVVALFSVLLGAGHASAAPMQNFSTNGTTFGTFGDHSFCRGAITYKVDAAPNKRGVVRVTATSHGFSGQGPSWVRNPNCRFLFRSAFTSVRGLDLEKWTTGSFGPERGHKKVWEVVTGSGPATVGITTYAVNSAVRVPQAPAGPAFFMLVP
ncbi:enoyl-CoA hydratase [Gordonia sp. 'Campus']|uniref:enoyl-CoA hydratase n=1 Tax=Gordonia sp. 'Campus' TaxID=2915824 RepID=UPI001EE4CCAC|nr:enoyl-CoA hydratase [Gordonia sp. 'Campus']